MKVFDKPCVVWAEVIAALPKTVQREVPNGDVDNYAKGPLDSLTKAQRAYLDDELVVGLWISKRYPEEGEEPGAHLHVFPLPEDI